MEAVTSATKSAYAEDHHENIVNDSIVHSII